MNKPTGSEIRVASPLKAWASRFALLLLVGAAFGLMLIGRTNSFIVEETRTAVTDMVTPILDAVSQPVETFSGVIDQAEALANLRSENLALKEQNIRLLQWQAVARRLEAENAALRSLNRMVPDPAMSYITARVVGDPGGAFVRTVLINAGERNGVEKGQAAVTADGVRGEPAINLMLDVREGRFDFKPKLPESFKPDINVSVSSLLLEALRRLDEEQAEETQRY